MGESRNQGFAVRREMRNASTLIEDLENEQRRYSSLIIRSPDDQIRIGRNGARTNLKIKGENEI